MIMLIASKNRVFISFVGPSETRKLQLIYNWLENGTFQPKLNKIIPYQSSQPLYTVMQREIESVKFIQSVKFEFIDSLKKQRYKVHVNLSRFSPRKMHVKINFL